MKWIGNVRKMESTVDDKGCITYHFRGGDPLEPCPMWEVNTWLGREVQVSFGGEIHCVVTGKKIHKTYGEGMSYEAFLSSPLATPSIVRPELSRIHEGIALRDEAWEREHHLQPHAVYVARTSHLKVGVTRTSNIPSRWVDQGAVEAVVVAKTPYRQLAGEMEVALKEVLSDKTHWRGMLSDVVCNRDELLQAKEDCVDTLGEAYESFFDLDDHITRLHPPVLMYPPKVRSVKLDKTPNIHSRLVGLNGQYWMFEDGSVWNVRSHAGYRVEISAD